MIKKILSCFFLLFVVYGVNAQASNSHSSDYLIHKKKIYSHSNNHKISIDGQWRGYFDSNGDIVASGNDDVEYVLELDVKGTKISGYSYSYFQNRAFYVICSLEGKYNKATHSLVVTETARIKGSTPPGWSDCLQTHILTYKQEGDTEMLAGTWKMAPGQMGDCGFGSTTLIRRTLKKDLVGYNKSKNGTPFSAPRHITKPDNKIADNNKKSKSLQKKPLHKIQPSKITDKAVAELPVEKNIPNETPPAPKINESDNIVLNDMNFEKRDNDLIKTVEINHESFRVDLYDNGVIDGDSISLFYNGKLILSHQRLSDTAITLHLNDNINMPVNELVMYADNLGEIPPNTALMVITDGDNRYEVPVTSDLKTSGEIRFVFKPKAH